VVGNLVGNALRYTPEGTPIELAVGVRTGEDGRRYSVIEVRDHGIGIPSSDLPLVFTPFHRAANVGRVDGSGLGLASVKQVVELHGGVVVAESHLGFGTTVTIHLPLATPSEVAAPSQ